MPVMSKTKPNHDGIKPMTENVSALIIPPLFNGSVSGGQLEYHRQRGCTARFHGGC